MELEQMDKAYARSKKALDKSGKFMNAIENLKKDVKTLTRQVEDIQIEIIRAKEDNDTAKVKTLEESKKAPIQALKAKKQQLQKLEAVVKQNQNIIDQKIDELSKAPALKAHLDEVIGKKFSRELVRKQKEKEDRTKQNETLTRIQEAAKKEPNVMYALKEIEKYTKLETELQAIIADPIKSATEKAQAQNDLIVAQNSLEKSRSDLARYFKGTISRDVIDKITSYEDIGKEIRANNRYLKGLDKQIANYETALENIGFESPLRTTSLDISSDTTRIDTRGTTASRTSTGRPAPLSNLPAEQPKWWQFVKRFKNWNARRKAELASEEPTLEELAPVSNKEKKKFKDSMKYEVVKDYEEKIAADLLKQAKAQNKEATDRDRDE